MMVAQNLRRVVHALVSSNAQESDLQVDGSRELGGTRDNVFCDKLSGARENRPGLIASMESLQSGDTLVIWRLER